MIKNLGFNPIGLPVVSTLIFDITKAKIVHTYFRNFVHFRWIKFDGYKFKKTNNNQRTYPKMDDLLNSDVSPIQDIYQKKNLIKFYSQISAMECARKCFISSACDMFEHTASNGPCNLFPYLSFKDKSWSTFTEITLKNTAIFILQCSTALENIIVGNTFDNKTPLNQRLKLKGSKDDTYKLMKGQAILSNNYLMLSSTNFHVSPNVKDTLFEIEAIVTENDLPLGMDNAYLKAFPQVIFFIHHSYFKRFLLDDN